jgi:superfamily II DNA or RNA helicase
LSAVVAGLAAGGRGQVIAACGSGKTLFAVHAALRLCPAGLVVLTCPSLPLLAQTLTEWAQTGVTGQVLAVCSDDTVADAAVHVADLRCPVTMDPAGVAAWARQAQGGRLRLVAVTHRSAAVAGQGLRAAGVVADLLLVDEAHRSAGAVDKQVAVVHTDAGVPAARRLYLTATPRVFTRRGTAADVLCMDDAAVFGPQLYQYPFARAIDDGLLDDFRVVAAAVTHAEVTGLLCTEGGDVLLAGQRVPLRTLLTQAAMVKAAEEFGLRRILAFTQTIAQSQQFAATLPTTVQAMDGKYRPKGRLTAVHVDGAVPVGRRQAALRLLHDPPDGGWAVVSNARCLAEGVNVPAVDAVTFVEPKKSEIDVVQAVGRALRRTPGGSGIATVIVPILLPDDPNGLDGDHSACWDGLTQVLRALRAHDATFAADLDAKRVRHTRTRPKDEVDTTDHDGRLLPQRVLLRLPDSYQTPDLLRHIAVRVLQDTTDDWLTRYAALQDFQATHRHTRLPLGHRAGGVDLYAWLVLQRQMYRAGQLAGDRVAALNELGVDWDPHAESWRRGLDAARAFHARHSHLRIPAGHVEDGVRLSAWLSNTRQAWRKGALAGDRVAALDELGVDWDPHAGSWRRNLDAARAFHARNGHLRVPADRDGPDWILCRWIRKCREDYRAGKLSTEEVKQLEAVGIEWFPVQAAWRRNLDAARAFHARNGHLRVPADRDGPDWTLFCWLRERREDYRAGKLSTEEVKQLEAVGIEWFPVQAAWRRNLDAARAFHARHGHLRVPADRDGPHYSLHVWMASCRRNYRAGKLPDERIRDLDTISIDWKPAPPRREP